MQQQHRRQQLSALENRHQQQLQNLGLGRDNVLKPASSKLEKILDEIFVGNAAIDPQVPKNIEDQGIVGILARNLNACIEWSKQLALQKIAPKTAKPSVGAYIAAVEPLKKSAQQWNSLFKILYGNGRNGEQALYSLAGNLNNMLTLIAKTVQKVRSSEHIDSYLLDVLQGVETKETQQRYGQALKAVKPAQEFKNVAPGKACTIEVYIVQFLTKQSLLMRELLKTSQPGTLIHNYASSILYRTDKALAEWQKMQKSFTESFCGRESYRKNAPLCQR